MVNSVSGVAKDIGDAMSVDDIGLAVHASTVNAVRPVSDNGGVASKQSTTFDFGSMVFNIYASEGQDIRELAKEVTKEIQNLIDDKEKAYA